MKIVPILFLCVFLSVLLPGRAAHAEFTITSAIVEFNQDGPRQQDIEIVSRSQENQYITAEVKEVISPGLPNESRVVVKDPAQSMILVTPDKTILAGSGRKIMRFVLLKEPDDREHIYRVAIKPVIKGVGNTGAVGLKILVGYEVLVIIRPAAPMANFTAQRQGKTLRITNPGNTNILLQAGQQCPQANACKQTPTARIYPGGTATIALPLDAPVTYSILDGKNTIDKQFD